MALDQRDAMMVLFEAVREVTAAGFAVTGNLFFARMAEFEPKSEGRLGTVAAPHAHLRFQVVPRGAPVVTEALPPPPEAPAEYKNAKAGDVCIQCGGCLWVPSVPCPTCANCGTPSGGCS